MPIDYNFSAISPEDATVLEKLVYHALMNRDGADHTFQSAQHAIQHKVPGVFVECGVAAGAAVAMLSYALWKAQETRQIWLYDSFEGIPMAGPDDFNQQPGIGLATHDTSAPLRERLKSSGVSAVSEEGVRGNLRRWGCKDDLVFVRGWFQDTLPLTRPTQPIALLRLDGDLYESTMTCLRWLYPLVSPGGVVIVDDYGSLPGCKKAVHDYLDEFGLTPEIQNVTSGGIVSWLKA